MQMSSVIAVCVLVVCVLSVLGVSGQPSGNGGGTCYESNGTVYECPKYNYTRYGQDHGYYQLRDYSLNTWAVEDVNATVLPSSAPQPTVGLTAVYAQLDGYFHGANADKLNITRAVAPVSVVWMEIQPGFTAYEGLFFLPTLNSYPASTNPNVTVVGGPNGGNLRVWSREFSLDHVPTDSEIVEFAGRFARLLEEDKRTFANISVMSYYDAIDAKGNWTKEIWFPAPPSDGDESFLQNMFNIQTQKATRYHRHQ